MRALRFLLLGIGALVGGDEPALAYAYVPVHDMLMLHTHVTAALRMCSQELQEEQQLPMSRGGMG